MQKLGRAIGWIIVVVFGATAIITLAGISTVWFGSRTLDSLPYLGSLFTSLIIEAVAAAFALFYAAMRYYPKTHRCRNDADFEAFITKFLGAASSATIFSNRLGWVSKSPAMQSQLVAWASAGNKLKIITAQPVHGEAALAQAGIEFKRLPQSDPPPAARFTLTNPGRHGAERLAIALGNFPDHVVYVFDKDSGPHIVALASELVRRADESGNERA